MDKPIYCVGGATVDHKLKLYAPVVLESSNPVESFVTFGGVARNVAANLAQWTHRIHLQCLVGNDTEGLHLLQQVQTLGINTDACMIIEKAKTAQYFAILTETGDLHLAVIDMKIYQEINSERLISHWQTWPDESIIFIDTNLSKSALEKMRQHCLTTQSLLCIDPVSVTKSVNIPDDLHGVFIIKPNRLEASRLTQLNIDTVRDCAKATTILLNRGVQNVVISLGKEGYFIATNTEAQHFHCQDILNIVDTNGAGDAFFAGILFGLQQSLSIKDACEIGAKAAANTLQSIHNDSQVKLDDLISHVEDKFVA